MIMRSLLLLTSLVFSYQLQATAIESEAKVQVSEMSEYFAKINTAVNTDAEDKSIEGESRTFDDESEILLTEVEKAEAVEEGLSPFQKMFISVTGIVLFALGFLAMVQKWGRREGYKNISNQIKVLTQKSLGPKKQLVLIRIAGETILLGVTDHNINNIKTLSLMDDELPDFVEPKFSGQLKKKIEETEFNDEPEEVDGFSISKLDQVKSEISKRYMS